MATYYVDGNSGNDSGDGSSNRPWKTLTYASNTVADGDEVRIRTATYRELLRIRAANSIWKADSGHSPVIDGNYHDGLFNADGTLPNPIDDPRYLPGHHQTAMVVLGQDGITLEGVTVQNIAGAGIAVGSSNVTIRNCRLDFIYGTGIRLNSDKTFSDNNLVENNVCTRLVQRLFDPIKKTEGIDAGGSALSIIRIRDSKIRNNVFAYSGGEGIDIGKGSYRITVEGNIVHTCNHLAIYINRSVDNVVRNNLLFHLYRPEYVGTDDKVPGGIVIGDEYAQGRPWPYSEGSHIYNNLVIGFGRLFHVRNNADNYNTQLNRLYIGHNTFIAGDKTREGISISANQNGRPHVNSLFENNVIVTSGVPGKVVGDISGIAFRNNLWSQQPPAAMRGPGDHIGNPNLVNVDAPLSGEYPTPNSNVEPRNYCLTERSALAIGMASDGSATNGLQPPKIQKDFFGANRDSKPDIGMHEFDGVAASITANFSVGPGQESGWIPHTVDFVDKSVTARPIVSWVWSFGDGQSATEVNPSHTYTEPGVYDVTLTVTDDQGHTDSLTRDDLVSTSEATDVVIPDSFRRFVIVQSQEQQVITFGAQYPDFRCVLIWNREPFHILNFADIEDVQRAIVVAEEMEIRWLDDAEMSAMLPEHEAETMEAL